MRSNGYAFQIEMSFRAWKRDFRIAEIPIVFVDRTEGTSKMSKSIVREAIWMVWRLRWWAHSRHHLNRVLPRAEMLPSGRTFYKMSGSGNDFVMVEALEQSADDLAPSRPCAPSAPAGPGSAPTGS